MWVSLADNYFKSKNVDIAAALPTLFCPKLTKNDEELDYQIVKDLHRTAYIGNKHEQQKLQRILLAYARYNYECGYCQGFNVIVAFIMEVTTDDLGTG